MAEIHSRSKHYSHRLRSGGAGRSARAPDPSEPSPYFDNSTSRNVTTSVGKTAFLPCKVRHLGDRTVVWLAVQLTLPRPMNVGKRGLRRREASLRKQSSSDAAYFLSPATYGVLYHGKCPSLVARHFMMVV
ncbi:hypothetical protein HPB48_014345 [Haemaphysalis longicornis]|uniref:Ig-like domain-containing protein n=1 Tax=Haemaphysalis longicornis TaxID=44386 RepID=A0A9J6G310_HAELO|nr:hypothetical protein HPB48_014345 [Haemaphysalis longicornis]